MNATKIDISLYHKMSISSRNLYTNTTADFFRYSRENGNPGCLWASKPQLDTRFLGYDGWGDSTFCWYSAVLFQRVAVVLT
jgi:hypothetical protein